MGTSRRRYCCAQPHHGALAILLLTRGADRIRSPSDYPLSDRIRCGSPRRSSKDEDGVEIALPAAIRKLNVVIGDDRVVEAYAAADRSSLVSKIRCNRLHGGSTGQLSARVFWHPIAISARKEIDCIEIRQWRRLRRRSHDDVDAGAEAAAKVRRLATRRDPVPDQALEKQQRRPRHGDRVIPRGLAEDCAGQPDQRIRDPSRNIPTDTNFTSVTGADGCSRWSNWLTVSPSKLSRKCQSPAVAKGHQQKSVRSEKRHDPLQHPRSPLHLICADEQHATSKLSDERHIVGLGQRQQPLGLDVGKIHRTFEPSLEVKRPATSRPESAAVTRPTVSPLPFR